MTARSDPFGDAAAFHDSIGARAMRASRVAEGYRMPGPGERACSKCGGAVRPSYTGAPYPFYCGHCRAAVKSVRLPKATA